MSYGKRHQRRDNIFIRSAVDRPASSAERAFAALTVATMLIISATLVLL